MKKLKDLFTIIRMQTLSEVNLGFWRLEVYQLKKTYTSITSNFSFILRWE